MFIILQCAQCIFTDSLRTAGRNELNENHSISILQNSITVAGCGSQKWQPPTSKQSYFVVS